MATEWKIIFGQPKLGWCVVEDGWTFQSRDSIIAMSVPFHRAIEMVKDHNRSSNNGRPRFPLSRDVVRYAMGKNRWKIAPAARMLGINRDTLSDWIKGQSAE